MFSLSTVWNCGKSLSGREMIDEIKALGFKRIELNFSLTESIVQEIVQLHKNGEADISSLHNYCPAPPGLELKYATPDCYSLASLNDEERAKAVHYTKRTIDTAYSLNARAVVLHCGRVEIEEKTRRLSEMYSQGMKDTRFYNIFKSAMIKERAEKRDVHLDAVCRSLEELSKYASGKDIKIGLENRYYYREIPTHDEIGMILNRFQGSNIFYWHDVGHAQIFENLGLARHIDYLEPNAYRIIGFHLHDIEGTKDHKSPHSGKFNFHILEPYVNNGTLKVLEIHPPATAGDIKRGVAYLNKIFGEGES